ncbi:hypothetical protein [Ensifer sp. Root31]|uniref:hypothetical protein n=1 Tax=Ensifer sp. Root31 TaxID=1736512 RepID=UPI0012E8E080|nr:hypothetical protein [Ensifer sp. Root31]
MISSDIRCEKLETPARDRHEFWDGGQIPIGIGDFGVADVGRERCHPIVDIGAMFVPKLNAAANKGVAQVMDAHFTMAAPRGPTEFGTKLLENLIDPRCSLLCRRLGANSIQTSGSLDLSAITPRRRQYKDAYRLCYIVCGVSVPLIMQLRRSDRGLAGDSRTCSL